MQHQRERGAGGRECVRREGRMGGREGRVRVRETRCDGDMVSVR